MLGLLTLGLTEKSVFLIQEESIYCLWFAGIVLVDFIRAQAHGGFGR